MLLLAASFASLVPLRVPAQDPQPPPPAANAEAVDLRLALLERLGEATWDGLLEVPPPAEAERLALTFDAGLPADVAYGRIVNRRQLEWQEGTGPHLSAVAEGGRSGGALQLGPGVEEDYTRARLVVPAGPQERVTVQARVRVVGNPEAEEGSQREALRVLERGGRSRRRAAARRLDPTGWDRVSVSFVTRDGTDALELQFLHRTGGSAEAVTLVDDVTIERTPLTNAEMLRDTRASLEPRTSFGEGHVRAALGRAGRRTEHRDGLWLTAGASVGFPVRLAAAERAPRLRFVLGMPPELRRSDADGMVLVTRLDLEDGTRQELDRFVFDPIDDRDHRGWVDHAVDLSPAAGRAGRLVFALEDLPGTDPDAFDALVLGTPRIEPGAGQLAAPNVLLIGVDTLRADRLSVYGHEAPTTPQLQRLADGGVRFTSARSQAPWTLPSFSSTLTSLYPSVHGAGRGGHDEWTGIDTTTLALSEVFARLGYETAGFVANGLISPQYGLDQGFEAYRWAWQMESAETDAETVAEFIDGHRDTPWLCFWHIMDPHLPYSTSDAFRERFTDAEYKGQFKGRRGFSVPFQVLDPRPGRRWFVHEGPPPPPPLEEGDAAFIADYYDAEIAEMDAAVGRVFDALQASGQWDRTVIAFFADHGEGLGDHGHYHHGYTLFDDQVHVPLLLRVPESVRKIELTEGSAITRPVACIDLAPTLLGALGLPIPDAFQGVDRLAPDAPERDGYAIEYPTYDSSAQKAWVLGRFKYMHDPWFHTEALYDLEADPGETTDVLAQHPDVAQEARAALDAFRWEQLQNGRFHLRVTGRPGMRLRVRIATDDLFDANFTSRPTVDEQAFQMDLERSELVLDTALSEDRLELVFWCRGEDLKFDVTLEGQPLRNGLELVGEEDEFRLPATVKARAIPVQEGDEVEWPQPGGAYLWLEAGAGPSELVGRTPEELESLRALGYAR